MSELNDAYFFDEPGYPHASQEEQPHKQGFIELRDEVAAIQGLSRARIEAHSKSDEDQKDAKGES